MEHSAEPVSWGVLGTANIALKKVIPAMERSEMSRVDAVASRSLGKASEWAARLGIDSAYGSYEELLADTRIEAIYIPLPNHLHKEWTVAAARAGKHVLCEKPLALTGRDARSMVEACEDAGVLLMEAFMYRLHPMWAKVIELTERGAIGDMRSVQTVFSYFNDDPNNIRNMPQVGGGALYDIGCYAVNTARMLFGSEPTGVNGFVRKDPNLGTDILTSAVLEFAGGHSIFVCSTQMERDQRVVVHGTRGRIVVEIPYNIPPDRPTRVLEFAGGDSPAEPNVTIHEIPAADPYMVQADVFSRAVRSGTRPPLPPSDAVANLEVIEQILASTTT